ncbi:membrane protein [Beggiatoa sp. PS]|nr:membrane protein [Beggiatoa sp. PS]
MTIVNTPLNRIFYLFLPFPMVYAIGFFLLKISLGKISTVILHTINHRIISDFLQYFCHLLSTLAINAYLRFPIPYFVL